MAEEINDNFKLVAAKSLDDRYYQLTIASRDLIDTNRRYQGLLTFVQQTQTVYLLSGGTSNTNWVPIWGPGAENPKISIEGNLFWYHPIIGNDGDSFEVGDLAINGWRSQNVWGKVLSYNGGDPTLFSGWDLVEWIGDETTL